MESWSLFWNRNRGVLESLEGKPWRHQPGRKYSSATLYTLPLLPFKHINSTYWIWFDCAALPQVVNGRGSKQFWVNQVAFHISHLNCILKRCTQTICMHRERWSNLIIQHFVISCGLPCLSSSLMSHLYQSLSRVVRSERSVNRIGR